MISGGVIVSMKFRKAVVGLVGLSTVFGAAGAFAGGGGSNEPRDTIGVVRDGIWFLRSSNDPFCTNAQINQVGFGATTDVPLAFDLDGDGTDQKAVFRDVGGNGTFFVAGENSPTGIGAVTVINFGTGTDIPVVGNFDPSDPGDEVGVYRPSTNEFFLDDGMPSPLTFVFGDPGDIPVVGNWDDSEDGSDEVGVYRPSDNTFYLRADLNPGAPAVTARPLGASGDLPVVGDFDRDGRTTIGVFRDLTFGFFFLVNGATGQTVDLEIGFGAGTDTPVAGDWDGPNTDEAGCL
jgi:hypothetical protein